MAVGGAILGLALAGCEQKGPEPGVTPQQRIASELDPCAEGGDGFARRVCGDQELAALDGQIRETLVAEAASVSEAGAELLIRNQARWREAQRIACGIVDPDAEPTLEQQSCLESEFRARAQDAQSAVQELGGYTFQRMELFDATPVTAEIASASGLGDEAPPAIQRDIRFPRIDGEQTPEIQRFNELVAQQPQFRLEDATNETVDYQIAYAGPEIVSVRFDMSADTLGAAHPNNTTKAVTVMMREGRALLDTDVFRANTGWQDVITQRAVRELTAQFRDYDFAPPERDVRESATKPHLWLVTERGLVILFPPYSFGGPYALGGADVTIPWSELRPYLNPGAPAPIGATS
ncbi:MAG: RsiV family protein [Hyphomonadaceae bacterium]|nr:RsiV family protein [Hyphomonadaceae bacterium]